LVTDDYLRKGIIPVDLEQIIASLESASDQDLSDALRVINDQAEGLRNAELSEDTVSTLERLADARAKITAAQESRSSMASRRQAALSGFTSTEETPEPSAPETPSTEETPAETTEETPATGDAVTASAGRMGAVTRAAGGASTERRAAEAVRGTTRIQGEVPGYNSRDPLNWESLTQALLEQFQAINNVGGRGRHHVARTLSEYPADRRLDESLSGNVRKMEAVQESLASMDTIVAAGGLCAPLENLYDINVLGITSRPVRDSLARFGVERGGIQYRMPMDALAMTSGLGIWTVDDDEAVGVVETPTDVPDPAKTCMVVDCPGLADAVVYSTYLCLQYPNFTARFDQEWVKATTRAAMVAWSRFAENELLKRILAGSKIVTSPVAVSATRDVLVTLDKAVAYYRNRHRLDSVQPLRLILPRWVLDLFRADLTRGFPGDLDALAVADSRILGWFRARGVNPTFHLDGLATATVGAVTVPQQFYSNVTAGSAIPGFVNSIDAALYAEGDWLFLDGGQLDLGLVRDSTLNKVNRYQQFTETWEGTAFNGIESLRLKMDVAPTGAVAGTIDTSAFSD
jgi:hypothetical protein